MTDLEPSIFILTILRFDLDSDVKLGPLTFHEPRVSLSHNAMGDEEGGEVAFAAGEVEMRVDTKVSFWKTPLFGGAILRLYTSSIDLALLERDDNTLAVVEARFPLWQGGVAELSMDASQCNEF